MSETVVSSVLSVTGTPTRWSRASGCSATDGTIPACQFEVGHRSSVTPRTISSAHRLGIVDRARSVGDPFGLERQRPADLARRRPTRRRGG